VPFREGDVVYHHRHSPPPDPRTRAENVPDGLAELILHLLVKNPVERLASARRTAGRKWSSVRGGNRSCSSKPTALTMS
jgi:hypothetical protein